MFKAHNAATYRQWVLETLETLQNPLPEHFQCSELFVDMFTKTLMNQS